MRIFVNFLLIVRVFAVSRLRLCGLPVDIERVRRGLLLSRTQARIPAAARNETMATSWLTRMPVENRYRLSVRRPSIHARPRPYQAT